VQPTIKARTTEGTARLLVGDNVTMAMIQLSWDDMGTVAGSLTLDFSITCPTDSAIWQWQHKILMLTAECLWKSDLASSVSRQTNWVVVELVVVPQSATAATSIHTSYTNSTQTHMVTTTLSTARWTSNWLVGCVAQLAERRSLTGELTLSCARLSADGWPLCG